MITIKKQAVLDLDEEETEQMFIIAKLIKGIHKDHLGCDDGDDFLARVSDILDDISIGFIDEIYFALGGKKWE